MDTIKLLPAHSSYGVSVFSYGGGMQSNAAMVLQATRRIFYDVFMFANVGNDSENPDTLYYVNEYAKPYCRDHHIPFVEVQARHDGELDTLLGLMTRSERDVPIPIRMSNTGMPGNRNCTDRFKIVVIDAALKRDGYTHTRQGLGISLDELHRARDLQWYSDNGLQKRREYPLIDLRLSRSDCRQIIVDAGLPVPPKSACWFCPFHRKADWIEMRQNQPDLFNDAVELEREINRKRAALGRTPAYLHRRLLPLDQAVGEQPTLFDLEDLDACDSGVCMV